MRLSEPRASTGVERRFRSFDGLDLAWTDYAGPLGGGALPMVCLPGLTRTMQDFIPLATKQSKRRRVIVQEYRGRGRSARPALAESYSATAHIEDLRHLLVVAGIHRAVFVGSSFGGLLSMAFASIQPTVVAGVVMNDIGPSFGGGLGRIRQFIGSPPFPADPAEAELIMRTRFPHLPARDAAAWRVVAATTFEPDGQGRMRPNWDPRVVCLMDAGDAPDPWVLFRALKPLPLLVFRGSISDVLTPETLEAMAQAHPGLIAVTVAGVGHTPALDEPDAEPALNAFLDRF